MAETYLWVPNLALWDSSQGHGGWCVFATFVECKNVGCCLLPCPHPTLAAIPPSYPAIPPPSPAPHPTLPSPCGGHPSLPFWEVWGGALTLPNLEVWGWQKGGCPSPQGPSPLAAPPFCHPILPSPHAPLQKKNRPPPVASIGHFSFSNPPVHF